MTRVTIPDQVKTPPPFGGTSDAWVRALSASLAVLAPVARGIARTARRRPFLCVITPVFDPARASVELLIEDLMRQTFGDFVHVMVSNGSSPEVAALVARVRAGDLGGARPTRGSSTKSCRFARRPTRSRSLPIWDAADAMR